MVTLKQLRNVNTLNDLTALGIGNVHVDINYRGGGVGFSSNTMGKYFNISSDFFPRYFGAGCNYLGGGLRGKIFPSTCHPNIKEMPRKANLLIELANACVRVYESIEAENNMNDELDEDGDINWEARGTNASRAAGITSNY